MLTTLVSGLFITLQHVKSVWDVLTAVHLRYSFTDYFILLLLDGRCFRLWQLYGLKFRTLASLRGVWAEEVSLCNWVIKCVHSWTSLKENELVIQASALKKGLSKGGQKGWSNCWLLYGRMLFVSWDPSSTIKKFSVKPKPQCFPKHNQKWTIVLSDLKKQLLAQ